MTVRVRIAPSPTGEPHIGTARTALFNWLFARHHGGQFVVRIEDTDRNRLVPGAVESIRQMLRWLGLEPDEGPAVGGPFGPYFQSERLDLYRAEIARLLADGGAYHCYCSPERLAEVNAERQRQKLPPGYDRHCRNLSPEERAAAQASDVTPVVRFAVPLDGLTIVHDAIKGEVEFENGLLQDAVLIKSDGYPTYHFAVVVDDHYMQFTHVLRGDEWLPSTPLHLLIYRALGWQPPIFAHLPLILGKDRSKLSKRHGDTAFKAFVEAGYLPDALVNFLGLLGWALDDKTEIISREQFVENFDLDGVSKSPAVFDFDKLRWMNREYIYALPEKRFATLVEEWLLKDLPDELAQRVTPEIVRSIAPELQTRIDLLSEVAPKLRFLFEDEVMYDRATLLGKRFAERPEEALFTLEEIAAELEDVEDWEKDAIWAAVSRVFEQRTLKPREAAPLLYVAITGAPQGVPVNAAMAALGKRRSFKRIKAAVSLLTD
ncbi:MAG TPA: glutamate--tRNA ligase [Dehalococcoidia bacterium]|nr:glutamate--tRNA ligase [Dehalococcoidia bacterium]